MNEVYAREDVLTDTAKTTVGDLPAAITRIQPKDRCLFEFYMWAES